MARGRLEAPNLDDRTWQEIKDQAIALIPQYAPEWTDHNPSDLGIALIELFAWMVEGLIYRLNQVPDKTYIHLLNLIGITRDPATPATTLLTFHALGDTAVDVPQGTRVSTQQSADTEAVVFETDSPIHVLPVKLKAALFTDLPVAATSSSSTNESEPLVADEDVTAVLITPKDTSHLQGLRLEITDQKSAEINLGFDKPATEPCRLYFRFTEPFVQAAGQPAIRLTWSYFTGTPDLVWKNFNSIVTDQTKSFRTDGTVGISFGLKENNKTWGADWEKHKIFAKGQSEKDQADLYWLKVVISLAPSEPGETAQAGLKLGLKQIAFNSVAATNALTVKEDLLGRSSGEPFQQFALLHRPLFKRPGVSNPYDHLTVTVNEGAENGQQWEPWAVVDDISPGEGKQLRVDPVTGTIQFGNGKYGKIPPQKSEIRANYRYTVGGVRGNVPANTVTVLQTPNALRSQVEVWNGDRASGGTDEEPIEETKRRAPQALRNRDRAVTIRDYEFLTREASTQIEKVCALAPRLNNNLPQTSGGLIRDRGHVNVIIIPHTTVTDPRNAPEEDPIPQPTALLQQEVLAYLKERCLLTAKVHVTGPRYLPIKISVDVKLWKSAIDDGLFPNPNAEENIEHYKKRLEDDFYKPIRQFLHPTLGGLNGTGWEIGQDFVVSSLLDYIRPSSEIGFIANITAETMTPLYEPSTRPNELKNNQKAGVWVSVADYEIICSSDQHQVMCTQADQ